MSTAQRQTLPWLMCCLVQPLDDENEYEQEEE
jgi:hypothetical protein